VLTIHCLKCDVYFDERDDACAEIACPRCGYILREEAAKRVVARKPNVQPIVAENFANFDHDWDGRGVSLLGRPGILRWTKNVVVRLISSACLRCGTQVRRGTAVCPCCRAPLTQDSTAESRLVPTLRKMFVAALVFIGLPAGLIVFLLVVCAPEVEKAKRDAPQPPSVATSGIHQAGRRLKKPEHGSHPSIFRSVREWLRGTEHRKGSAASKPPLEETGDRTEYAHVPQMRPRDCA
jgi:hypothetical protein